MNDARGAYRRNDASWNEANNIVGSRYEGIDRQFKTLTKRQESRYVPYGKKNSQAWKIKEKREMTTLPHVEQIESYAHSSWSLVNAEPSRCHSADNVVYGEHRSSGKRLASQIVTPARNGQDDNVTKRARV